MMDQLIEEERQSFYYNYVRKKLFNNYFLVFNFNNLSQLDWERYFRFFCNGVHVKL